MIIRSQDKKTIVVFQSIGQLYTDNTYDASTRIYADFQDGRTAELGKYSTEGKAMKVLDMIQNLYLETVSDNETFISDIPKVFIMPQDSEVN